MNHKSTSVRFFLTVLLLGVAHIAFGQSTPDSVQAYKKRVLESTEIDLLTSYYSQDGDNAAVSGGKGTEELTDVTGAIVVSIPLSADDVLTVDVGISAYTSASSSNIDPFDRKPADPFQASSGASQSDTWFNLVTSFSHSSDDRNKVWSVKGSIATEYDYFSAGFGGSYSRLFNQKNTEVSAHASVYLDTWHPIYPIEIRPFSEGGKGLEDPFFSRHTITGNSNYNPNFTKFSDGSRNSYAIGFGFSQILSKRLQGSLALDFVQQQGLLSTPFQRVYFSDVADSFIDNFHLADNVEQLPDRRFKVAMGGRLNWYVNEILTVRSFYRFYFDDWGISSNTASIELAIKVLDRFTLYPSYRFYNQTAADYFYPYNEALSTDEFYTSDYDLSKYQSNQFGFGISYTDIFASAHLWKLGLKSIDLNFYTYSRNSAFKSSIITAGFKFVID